MAEEPATHEGGQPEGGKPEGKPEGNDKTFTQAELDQVVRDRLKRERDRYADYDDLKTKASKFDEYEEQNRSATEKAIAKAASDAKAEAQREFEQERRGDRLRVAVAKRARDLADVDDVVLNVERGDLDGLFDKDGAVDEAALGTTLDDLLERKPHLKAGPPGTPSGDADGGRGQGGSSLSPEDQHNQDLLRLAGLKR